MSAIDLMYAYAQATLDDETIKLTGFSSGDKLFAFIRRLHDLECLPNFFTQQMSLFSKYLSKDQRSALVCYYDILFKSNSKPDMLQLNKQLHDIAHKVNLNLSPEKYFFMLLTAKFLGHKFGFNTIKAIQYRNARVQQLSSPTTKIDLMKYIGSMSFCSIFNDKHHVKIELLYNLLYNKFKFHWIYELQKTFSTN